MGQGEAEFLLGFFNPQNRNKGTAEQMNIKFRIGAKRKIICEANNDRREWFMSKCQNATQKQYISNHQAAEDAKPRKGFEIRSDLLDLWLKIYCMPRRNKMKAGSGTSKFDIPLFICSAVPMSWFRVFGVFRG